MLPRGCVLHQKWGINSNPICVSNHYPILDMSLYEVEFTSGEEANIIVDSMYAQYDVDTNE